jgi:starvation-inducible DNA-binding protein
MVKENEGTLADKMKVVLATSFAFYLKTHNYHWNVEGENFSEYHTYLGTLYEEVWGAVDLIAEQIRTLDEYAPGSLGRFYQLSTISDESNIPTPINMMRKLVDDNKKVLDSLMEAHAEAEKQGKRGIVNFLEGRIDIHEKHGWMLRSYTKGK